MEETELFISGIGISRNVISQIVTLAAQGVEGVASVGGNDLTSNLISVFTRKAIAPEACVESLVNDEGALEVTVHLSVFYGYPFTKLAESIREAVARSIFEQVGIEVGAVNVCIDGLVFPKE